MNASTASFLLIYQNYALQLVLLMEVVEILTLLFFVCYF